MKKAERGNRDAKGKMGQNQKISWVSVSKYVRCASNLIKMLKTRNIWNKSYHLII